MRTSECVRPEPPHEAASSDIASAADRKTIFMQRPRRHRFGQRCSRRPGRRRL